MQEEDKKNNGGYESEGSPLIGLIRERFQQAETSKVYDEKRWLKAYRNYRGLYGPEMAFRENEKSRVFVKITKTKVLASFGQIIDVLFAGQRFPLGVEATRIPTGVDEAVNFVIESRRASISAVQRKLRIGYNRAARLIESMEAAGLVSEMSSNGSREVLVPKRN